MYFRVRPEVAGELGVTTVIDTTVHPPIISRLEHRFEGWLGDDLLTVFPVFIVTEKLRTDLEESPLTGFSFDDVTITKSELFEELYPERALPGFSWLKINGQMGIDDFAETRRGRLVVSERALDLLRQHHFQDAEVEELHE